MTAQLRAAIARIRQTKGKVVGAGFLVSNKHILTCAHVVNAAVGRRRLDDPNEPDQEIHLDFPLVASGKILRGRLVQWIPVQPSSFILPETGADIALLELESTLPEGTQPVRLIKAENLWKHPFRVFGFPEGQAVGVWTDGIISDPQANGRVQIEVVRGTTYPIEPGFSGSPVWDEQLDGVAGMTVAIDPLRPAVRAAFMTPTTQLINTCPELEEQAIPPCPYRGLFAFREQDAKFFFGRETFTQQLVQAVQRQSLVAVIGASGSGKSSVVFAALIPHLRSEEGWLIEAFRPGDRPFRNLAARLVPLLETEMSETDQLVEVNKQAKALQQRDLGLEDVVRRILEKKSGSRLLLIADQFEELYTLCQDNSERQIFLDQLLDAVNQTENFTLVLTLRADFCGYALSYRPFADALQDAVQTIGPMNQGELQEAIEKPAQLLGVRIESGLTERILKAVEKEPGNLPLLEFALTLLWAKQQNAQLTHQAYEEIGGVEKALAEYAEEQYGSLSEEDKQRAQRAFIQLVRPGAGTEDTRRLATRDEVGEDNWDLMTRLASARLVVTNKSEKTGEKEETNQETVEIIHEALIREWETLQDWMKVNREFRTWQERLKVRMREWERSCRDEGALLRGVSLAEAEDWFAKHQANLSQAEQNFIQTSQTARKKRQRNTQLTLVSIFSIVISLASVASFGWQRSVKQETEAKRQSHIANIVAADISLQNKDFESAERRLATSDEQFHLLEWQYLQRLLKSSQLHIHGKDGAMTSVEAIALSSDGSRIVSGSWDDSVRVFDANSGKNLLTLFGHEGIVEAVGFSPDGSRIVSGSWDNTARIWDAHSGELLLTLEGHTGGRVTSVAFSPDGNRIFSISETLHIWDAKSGELIKIFRDPNKRLTFLAVSPDGTKVIGKAVEEDQMHIWDIDTSERLLTLERAGPCAAFSSDGMRIATCGKNNTVQVWDASSGKPLLTLEGHESRVGNIAFSLDGKLIVSHAEDDKALRVWDSESGLLVALIPEPRRINSLAFSPNGKSIISGTNGGILIWDINSAPVVYLHQTLSDIESLTFSNDNKLLAVGGSKGTNSRTFLLPYIGFPIIPSNNPSICLWRIDTIQDSVCWNASVKFVLDIAFSPDTTQLASAGSNGAVRLWDVHSRELLGTFRGHTSAVKAVVFCPDGKCLVTGSQNGNIRMWDLTDGKLIWDVKAHKDDIDELSFSPDGNRLASASWDKTVKVLDAATGKELLTLSGHEDSVASITFSHDGKFLASGGFEDSVKIWNANSGKLLYTLSGHTNIVNSVAFSPDGKRILSFSHNLRFYDAETGEYLLSLSDRNLSNGYGFMAINPDGNKIAAGSGDTVVIWNTQATVDPKVVEIYPTSELELRKIIEREKETTISRQDLVTSWTRSYNIGTDPSVGFELPLKLESGSAEAYYQRAKAYEEKGDFDLAIADLDRAIKLNPQYAKAYTQRAIIYYFQNNYDFAIEDSTRALGLEPENVPSLFIRGAAHSEKGNLDQARDDYRQVIQLYPNYLVYRIRGVTYFKEGDYDKAISDYNKAIKLNSEDAKSYFWRGKAYHRKGNLNQAVSDYTEGIRFSSNSESGYNNLASALFELERFEKALEKWNKALQINPKSRPLLLGKAIALEKLGHHLKALETYKLVFEEDESLFDCNNMKNDFFWSESACQTAQSLYEELRNAEAHRRLNK